MQNTKLVEFSRESYKALCEEMAQIMTEEKELEARKNLVKEELIAQAGGDRMEYGIKISLVKSRGSIDYKKAFEAICADEKFREEFCELYRKEPTQKVIVTKY